MLTQTFTIDPLTSISKYFVVSKVDKAVFKSPNLIGAGVVVRLPWLVTN